MRILYLSDFNCPYSYIGLNRITNAVSELGMDVEWEMKSFELEPAADNFKAAERFAAKNGLSFRDGLKEIEEIERIAHDEGLNINYRDMIINPSKDAHRLVKYVQERYSEASMELVFRIFEANFTRNDDISSHEVLLDISTSCGLDESEMREFLKKDSLGIEVDLDMEEAISNGITTIPYYFIEYRNERLIIPGVYEKESFKVAIKDLSSGEMRNKSFI